jgi:uncharacterized delta-60 repeat protein
MFVASGFSSSGYSRAFDDGSAIFAYYRSFSTGTSGFAVSRMTPQGTVDMTFGVAGEGFVPNNLASGINGLEVDAAGNIYVIGPTFRNDRLDWMIGKFTPRGLPDVTFGTAGVVVTDFTRPGITNPQDYPWTVKVDSKGRIVVGGQTSTNEFQGSGNLLHAVARYLPNGQLDTTFDGDGKAVFGFDTSVFDREFVSDIEFMADGDLLLASAGGSDTALVRLNENGSFDSQLGNDGVLSFPFRSPLADPRDIRIDEQGRILMVGYAFQSGSTVTNFAIGRILANGAADMSFANGGRYESFGQYSQGYAFDIQPDGKLVAVGIGGQASPTNNFNALVARYDLIPEPAGAWLLLVGLATTCGVRYRV